MAAILFSTVTSGSETLELGSFMEYVSTTIHLQIVTGSGWSGSFQPLRSIHDSVVKDRTLYTNQLDGLVYSGSITQGGLYSIDASGGRVFLQHSRLSGSASVHAVTLLG